uniref:Uncharacterized protein n=1 Tax=viral metagenome TaxID=1070528 RepID=A0A6C0IWF7_9ZZZZ
MPRDGIITDLSATFVVTAAATLAGEATVHAQLYLNGVDDPTNFFIPINATDLPLSPSLDVVTIGTILRGQLNGLSIPVVDGDRLLLVFTVATSVGLTATVTGVASAGVNIN